MKGSEYNTSHTFAVIVSNKVPSFVSGPQARIETGKAIIGAIVPQALKSYQHEGWEWGTPMAPCIILA